MKLIERLKDFSRAYLDYKNFQRLPQSYRKIVFYAEDQQSQNYISDLVFELTLKKNETVCYLASDINGSIFDLAEKNSRLKVFYIGLGIIRTLTFINLRADLLITTMPDLQTYHLKKSIIYDVHYLYIFHALVSTHSNYRKGAFDNFDTIFCVGPHHLREIRETENIYKLNKKNLFRDGYRPLEYLIKEKSSYSNKDKDNFGDKIVLLAPSWGENSILEYCGTSVINYLLDSNNEVYLRLHPMTQNLNPELVYKIKDEFINIENFHLEEEISDRITLFKSDILITDWSGIGLEYAFGLLKPVIFVDTPKKNNNPESHLLTNEPIEKTIRSKIGKVIAVENLHNINSVIENTIFSVNRSQLISKRNEYVFNTEGSMNRAVNRIVSLANSNQKRNIKKTTSETLSGFH